MKRPNLKLQLVLPGDVPENEIIAHRLGHSNHDVEERARQDETDFETARRALEREAIAAAPEKFKIVPALRKAIGLETAAEKQLNAAKAERERAEQIQAEWDRMVTDLERFDEKVETGLVHLQQFKELIATNEAHVKKAWGDNFETFKSSDAAVLAVQRQQALPMLEEAQRALELQRTAHIEKMREWGKENSVPKEILRALPE
jgi:hypothetical protein